MSEQKRIVVEDFPVERLPEELRQGLVMGHRVRVTIEDDPQATPKEPRYRRFRGIAADRNTSIEEAVARVRALRDEWD
jgi:hypothetical protein